LELREKARKVAEKQNQRTTTAMSTFEYLEKHPKRTRHFFGLAEEKFEGLMQW
jgi:hypothetical protein